MAKLFYFRLSSVCPRVLEGLEGLRNVSMLSKCVYAKLERQGTALLQYSRSLRTSEVPNRDTSSGRDMLLKVERLSGSLTFELAY